MIFSEADRHAGLSREEKIFLSALFSDETENYRFPAEPEAGEQVKLRLRTARVEDLRAWVILDQGSELLPMHLCKENEHFLWFETELTCPERPVTYCFLTEWVGRCFICQRYESLPLEKGGAINFLNSFRLAPGFHTPAWARGALQYQIFVDRFRNGNRANDVVTGEYIYGGEPVRQSPSWDELPRNGDFRCFYGGDLQGVMEKLDYIQSLGVEAIYFNPIFLSPSSHKYDTQDYEHIDPHFGVIREGATLRRGISPDTDGSLYVKRVTDYRNLWESDDYFARLCEEIHSRGMKIILDGVFNHCGSFNKWLDREGVYRRSEGSKTGLYQPGAYQSRRSPYRKFFRFHDDSTEYYEAWWNHDTLPKLNYEGSQELREAVYNIACKWAKPPYSIDGWRLDVAADLGHSSTFNHHFWAEFRRRLKAVNPELLILAEHYGDPSSWLQGDQWDSVMNYDAFMEPVSYFLTGMEKHSDNRRDDFYQNGVLFFQRMRETMSRMDWMSIQCAMNELSNHDHSRFLTRTNRVCGRLETRGSEAAEQDVDMRVMREAVVMQMTLPGAPTIYYGDEAGLCGWTDPDNRRTYPWGHEDESLIAFHKSLAALRKRHPVLRHGSFKPLDAGMGWVAYARFDGEDCVVTVVNNSDKTIFAPLHLRDVEAEEGASFHIALETDSEGWTENGRKSGTVQLGVLHLFLQPKTALILERVGR